MRNLNCTIIRPDGSPLPNDVKLATNLTIDTDPNGPKYGLVMDAATSGGRAILRFPDCAPMGQGASLEVFAAGGFTFSGRVVTPMHPNVEMGQEGGDSIIKLQKSPVADPFSTQGIRTAGSVRERLRVRGHCFELESGTRWTAIECSDFQLLQRFLNNEDITPILKQRAELGFNLLRVFGMCEQMFKLHPQDFGDRYFKGLSDFLDLCGASGFYVEFTVFADATVVMPSQNDQLTFWGRVCDAVRPKLNVLLEAINEADQVINRLDSLQNLPRPSGILASHGSNGSQQAPVRPPWSYETFHTNDASEWWRKTGHNAMEVSAGADGLEGSRLPIIANENTRYPDKEQSPTRAFDAMAAAALLCAGACYHSVDGKVSQLFNGLELECAKQWVLGAKSVNLDFQDGSYQRPDNLMRSDDLRVYQRIVGGVAETVHIRK